MNETITEDAAITDTAMNKRTWFLVNTAKSPLVIAEQFTCDDVREQLLVEQVDARLTGTELGIDKLSETYPEAVKGAHFFSVMKSQAKADPTLKGPFTLVTPTAPTTEDLLAWFIEKHGSAVTPAEDAAPSSVQAVRRAAAKKTAKAK
jgi:hypothetical protein